MEAVTARPGGRCRTSTKRPTWTGGGAAANGDVRWALSERGVAQESRQRGACARVGSGVPVS
jgi:hypothetical protein